jgi:amidohydrolase
LDAIDGLETRMDRFPELSPEDTARLIETRRDLHRHPELGFEEQRTAGIVAERLRAAGYSPTTGIAETGVTAMWEGEADGPCVLLRADMDALPIHEETEVPFTSAVDGKMHACGHDVHTATLLTVAEVFARVPRSRGSIKFVFQPAEEGIGGAERMVEAGVLDDPKVDAAFGLHVWSQLEPGKIAVTDGAFMAAVDGFEIKVTGRGGHAAMPEDTADPVIAAAHIVTALQTIASRRSNPLESVVISVTTIHGGDAFNVIPETVTLGGTARSFEPELWKSIPALVEDIATHTARAHGCTCTVEFERMNKPTVNDPAMAALVRQVAIEHVGKENVQDVYTMGGEDFSEMLMRVPGCFFFVGAAKPTDGVCHPHHSPKFDLDESAFALGARVLGDVALRFLSRGS